MIRFAQIKLIANHTFKSILKAPINRWLIGAFLVLIAIALFSSYLSNSQHHHDVAHYSEDVRESWENNPDKHPHRMAHYGYVAFREKYPLSFFDKGLDSYLGNAVFLEAHRQNSVNFSQASMSNGLLRFGELSAGLILQLLLPLLIFFLGFALVAREREQGVLKILLTQGASWSDIILGKSVGLFLFTMTIFIPAAILAVILLILTPSTISMSSVLASFGTMVLSYMAYLFIMCGFAVWISAQSKTPKSALIQLIGLWLFFTLIIPKVSQVAGQVLFPTPSKIEFDTIVEEDLIKQGDSHNPDDPHYQALKDSLLSAYGVTSTDSLPFNYSGFVMREGERLSTETFRKHQQDLISLYEKQSEVVNRTALLNPYIAIKNISMTLSGTDFAAYQAFNTRAEEYRYGLAQTMNELQIEHISNNIATSSDKKAVISKQYWKDFEKFDHGFLSFGEMFNSAALSFGALLLWLLGFIVLIRFFTHNLKAI